MGLILPVLNSCPVKHGVTCLSWFLFNSILVFIREFSTETLCMVLYKCGPVLSSRSPCPCGLCGALSEFPLASSGNINDAADPVIVSSLAVSFPSMPLCHSAQTNLELIWYLSCPLIAVHPSDGIEIFLFLWPIHIMYALFRKLLSSSPQYKYFLHNSHTIMCQFLHVSSNSLQIRLVPCFSWA
jgi:hypothetical protein